MKTPAGVDAMMARFDRMSLRERLLVFAALLVGVLVLWQTLCMEQLGRREQGLSLELKDLQDDVSRLSRVTEAVASTDPTTAAMKRLQERDRALDAINAKLAAESAGLIPPAQMVQVIHEVLQHQQGLTLVSLRNLPVRSLVPQTPSEPAGSAPSSARADLAPPAVVNAGPYLHPVELIVEGRYLDIVAYLHALEGLQWHFYWRVLELETRQYPLNRVRIELSTVSLDKEWIGV